MLRSHEALQAVEAEMKATGTWVFSGRLDEPETATVVRNSNGTVIAWADKVTAAITVPIEVRPFVDQSYG
jgi:hypothetical protein